jgi:hypothetical protein
MGENKFSLRFWGLVFYEIFLRFMKYFEVPNYTFGLNVCQFVTQKTFKKKSIGVFFNINSNDNNSDN